MSESALIGIDLGKHDSHLHGEDNSGCEVFRRKLSRAQMMQLFGHLPSCTVVMEARQLASGHTARLVSAQLVKPFVKGNKNDFVDAESICGEWASSVATP